jgi:uncharacterized membrane protein
MPLVLYHLIAIIVLSAIFFFFKRLPKRTAGPVEWAIGDYFSHLNRKIHGAKTLAELMEVRSLVDGFYKKNYQTKPTIILRRALRKSLLISFSRKLKDIKDGSTVC